MRSLYGWKVIEPRAAGTMNLPPLNEVPVGAVVTDVAWQMSQPIEWKRLAPAMASEVAATTESRGGTLVERMKRVNAPMSAPFGSAVVGWSSGSATVS